MSEHQQSLVVAVMRLCEVMQQQNKILLELVEQNAHLIAATIDHAEQQGDEQELYDLSGRRISN